MSEELNAIVSDESVNAQSVESSNTEVAETEPKEGTVAEPKEGEEGFVPFPKKALNALSARDKKIAKLTARIREYEAREYAKPQQQQQVDDEPKEENFATYGDFLQAKTIKAVEKMLAAKQSASQEEQTKQQFTAEQQVYITGRAQEIDKLSAQYSKTIPDFDEVQDQNVEIVTMLPRHVQMAMLEADDPALAFYNLAKEGRLAELADMTPTRAAMVIAQAASKPPAKQVSRAPNPLRGVSGAGMSRSEDNLSGRELRKKVGLI